MHAAAYTAAATAAARNRVSVRDGGGVGGGGGCPSSAMDMIRVWVVGWGYGGFFVLLRLDHLVGLVTVAGAPVLYWRLCDSAHTEHRAQSGEPNGEKRPLRPLAVLGVVATHGASQTASAAGAANAAAAAASDVGAVAPTTTAVATSTRAMAQDRSGDPFGRGRSSPSAWPSPLRPPCPLHRSLLIVQCLSDGDVALTNTGASLDALATACLRGVRLLLFPRERHGPRSAAAQVAFEADGLLMSGLAARSAGVWLGGARWQGSAAPD